MIFTGAQFAADHPSPDGPGNLADAVTLAEHEANVKVFQQWCQSNPGKC